MELPETARLLAAAAAFSHTIAADDERVVRAWHAVIGDLPYTPAARAVQAYYRTSSYPITPADIVNGVADQAPSRAVPHHLRCPDHPDRDVLARECVDCRRLTIDGRRMIAPPAADLIDQVKSLAAKAKIDARSRDRERADALKARADAAAQRAAEKLEKQRQLNAYRDHQPPETPGASSCPKETR